MRLLKKIITPTGWKLGLIATFFGIVIYWTGVPFFQLMELKAYDLHFFARGRIAPGKEVVIAAIDEKSLNAYGRWPWPRTRIAELLTSLKSKGASVVAFDIVFPYEDESSGISAIRELKRRFRADARVYSTLKTLEKKADNDANLEAALRDNEAAILGYYFFLSKNEIDFEGGLSQGEGYFTNSAFNMVRPIDESEVEPDYMTAAGAKENLPAIAEAALNYGFFNIVPDDDGVVRWAPLAIKYEDTVYPHLSLSAVRAYLGGAPLILNVASYGVDSIQTGKLTIPTNEHGNLTINYRGPGKTFPRYSIVDIVDD